MATVKIRGTKGKLPTARRLSVLDLVGDRRFKLAKRVLMGSDDKTAWRLANWLKGEGYNVYVSMMARSTRSHRDHPAALVFDGTVAHRPGPGAGRSRRNGSGRILPLNLTPTIDLA
jgi:hypothetical protein